jgi:hypothetical protein
MGSIAAGPCKVTTSDCSAMISGLNDQGKQQVPPCVAKGCGARLYSYVEGLSSAPSPSTEGMRPQDVDRHRSAGPEPATLLLDPQRCRPTTLPPISLS